MYVVIYTKNNGYTCSCCRQEWTYHEEFDNYEDVKKFLISSNYKNDSEIDINHIYKVEKELQLEEFEE